MLIHAFKINFLPCDYIAFRVIASVSYPEMFVMENIIVFAFFSGENFSDSLRISPMLIIVNVVCFFCNNCWLILHHFVLFCFGSLRDSLVWYRHSFLVLVRWLDVFSEKFHALPPKLDHRSTSDILVIYPTSEYWVLAAAMHFPSYQ